MTSKLFGMVTLNASWPYTFHSLASFAQHTVLDKDDRFILIDNDGSASESGVFSDSLPGNYSVHKNDKPRSFAENANFLLEEAEKTQSDVYFLNNDIIFTPNWIDSLLPKSKNILIPACNQQFQYQINGFQLRPSLDLENYFGHENDLLEISAHHRSTVTPDKGYSQYMCVPFYCVKIPHSVYSIVGNFDTNFGPGGAEDTDYSLRCALSGIGVFLSLQSYILHFQGKSTWRGPETPAETAARNSDYKVEFCDKWGVGLTKMLLEGKQDHVLENPKLKTLFEERKLGELILAMLDIDGMEIPKIAM